MTNRCITPSGATPLLWLICLCMMLSGCSLPPLENRTVSSALSTAEARTTQLGQAISPRVTEHSGKSGIYPLQDPHDAFAARVHLAEAAERTLDIQYYIWRGDMTGTMLLETLHSAGDRGVRVRLLLDDNGVSGLDTELAALDRHANIEVRLFNPFVVRNPKWLGYLTDFPRLNRRMHNKSFTADNQATIIGGRNVGDEYFGAGDVLFADLDVLAVGPVVDNISSEFDRYWASRSAYPVARILPFVNEDELDELAATASAVELDPAASAYVNAVRQSDFLQALLAGTLELEWAPTRMVSDDPAKALGEAEEDELLTYQLQEIVGKPSSNVELVSPYFVPAAAGTAALREMGQRDLRVRVLTNALDATDMLVVHAGYAKRRKALLEAGIRLYEMRSLGPERVPDRGFGSSISGSSLHAKTFAVDGEQIFVGSFNFDPRSANLNTELGFVIASPALAQQIETAFDQTVPGISYEVRLDEEGELYWLEQQGDRQIRYRSEPQTGFWQRAAVFLLAQLPIEWLL